MGYEMDMRICNLKDILIQKAYEQNLDTVDAKEMGEVVDMIKDIAEYERNHYEACYYKSVVNSMNRYNNDRAGYVDVDPIKMDRFNKLENPYWDGKFDNLNWDGKYDKAYNEYKTMRRHYTESHSQDDKAMMDRHANEHINTIVETVKDIWNDADPNLRQQMRDKMTNLLNEMV